jgi:hypothetical protein
MSHNAFRNSFHYDAQQKRLYIHVRRTGSSGDFALVLMHAISHIKVSPAPWIVQSAQRIKSKIISWCDAGQPEGLVE